MFSRIVRDEWESKKASLEQQLSEKLGATWTIDINNLAIFPYAKDDWAKSSFGSLIASYVDGAVYQLGYFPSRHGAASLAELNDIAHAHVLTMDVDEAGTNSYCGCAVQEGGRLAILFNEKNFGVNVNDALEPDKLLQALNNAPSSGGSDGAVKLSFAARTSVRTEYDPQIGAIRERIAKLLQREDVQLVPNFEETFAKLAGDLKAASGSGNKSSVDADNYERQLGMFVRDYFDGVAYHLDSQKFGSDDMLQEGFNEAVEKGVIAFRIVDKLAYGSYCEVVVEDGTLYVQTTLARYGVNTNDAAEKLIDQL